MTILLKDLLQVITDFGGWIIGPDSSGLLTLVTGLIAWGVYRHQLRLREKEAAIIILSEIAHIEDTIEVVLGTGFDPYNELINISPNCSWDKNFQIFARFLGGSDFNLLNSFFNASNAAQKLLEKLREILDESQLEKARLVQSIFLSSSEDANNNEVKYRENVNKTLPFFDKEPASYRPNGRLQALKNVVSRIPKITGTTVFEKLSKIATRRF